VDYNNNFTTTYLLTKEHMSMFVVIQIKDQINCQAHGPQVTALVSDNCVNDKAVLKGRRTKRHKLQPRHSKFYINYINLRNNISQTVILLLNNITVWTQGIISRGRSRSDILIRIRTTNSDVIKQ
jgi:hypothetical protein